MTKVAWKAEVYIDDNMYDLHSRERKKDSKVQGEIHLIIHFKVDKTKLPGKMEIQAQYEAALAAQVLLPSK